METGLARKGNRLSLRMTSGLARKHGLPVCMTVNPSPESVHFTLPLTPAGRGHSAAMQGNLKVQAPDEGTRHDEATRHLGTDHGYHGLNKPRDPGEIAEGTGIGTPTKKPPRQAGRRTISLHYD